MAGLAAMATTAAVVLLPSSKKPGKEDARFVSTRVRKEFADVGTLHGIVVRHVKPVKADLGDDNWIMQYTNVKLEVVDPQTLLLLPSQSARLQRRPPTTSHVVFWWRHDDVFTQADSYRSQMAEFPNSCRR